MGKRRDVSFGPQSGSDKPTTSPPNSHQNQASANSAKPMMTPNNQADPSSRGTPPSGQQQRDINESSIANWTRKVGIFTGILAAFTGLLVFATGFSDYFLWQSDVAIEGQLQESKADRRPWMIFNQDDVSTVKPLTFDAVSATIEYKIPLTNTGKSVASRLFTSANLNIKPSINALMPGRPFTPVEMRNLIHSAIGDSCSPQSVEALTDFGGEIVAPGGQSHFTSTLNQDGATAQRTTFVFNSNTGDVSAWIPFCVGYRDDGGNIHGTGVILNYFADVGGQHFSPSGTVPGHLVIFSPSWNAY